MAGKKMWLVARFLPFMFYFCSLKMMQHKKLIRYCISLVVILLMVGVAEWTGEKEILFPEMVALTVGLFVIDKRVWNVRRWQVVLLMSAGAVFGMCVVRYSPLPYLANLCVAFAFAGTCLLISRTTLIPLISACVLPVMLHTESLIYPLAVLSMSLLAVFVQKIMEMYGIRSRIVIAPIGKPGVKDFVRWAALLGLVGLISAVALGLGYSYLILPPLMVTFAEMVNSKAGFRNRPTQVFLFLTVAAIIGTSFQLIGYYYLHLPESLVALCIAGSLFLIFEWTQKYFAPAGALAFIPLLLPREGLAWMSLQAAIGAALFIAVAMIVFQQCYKWNKAQLVYCLTPTLLRKYLSRKNKE